MSSQQEPDAVAETRRLLDDLTRTSVKSFPPAPDRASYRQIVGITTALVRECDQSNELLRSIYESALRFHPARAPMLSLTHFIALGDRFGDGTT